MKPVILFAAFNLIVATHCAHASLAHLPCNIAYSIAELAEALIARLTNQFGESYERGVHDLEDVKAAYLDLAQHLATTTSDFEHENAHLLCKADYALLQTNEKHAALFREHGDIIARMLALNERLIGAGL